MARTGTDLRIATFRVEVTPPLGSPLCGGWIPPVSDVADPLYAVGVVLLTRERPLVLCAVDWCELNNAAHDAWRLKLAAAVRTTPDRVTVHTVHQHNAPIMDLEAQRLIAGAGLPHLMDLRHFRRSLRLTAKAARRALRQARAVSHVGIGMARVSEVASARRILGSDGRIRATRWSSCKDPALCAEPEGVIDPMLRTVLFLDGSDPVAALHYYATHPMSYYGDGIVTSDFAGLARERRRAATPGCEHLYFSGCGGNVTAGKYNDGTPESRAALTGRMERAMEQSERSARILPATYPEWRTTEVTLPPREDLNPAGLAAVVADASRTHAERSTAALRLAYFRRVDKPITLSCLRLGSEASILHLPGEAFVEYQLAAGEQAPFVAVAAYGDSGTGYIPLARSYAEGGYEVGAASVSAGAEPILRDAIGRLLRP
jgi:hypothetical protein